jgi:pimeloyl-ACP methyl ester carboxylesterase
MEIIDDVLTLADGRRIGFRVRGDRRTTPIVYFHGEPGSRLEADVIPDDALAEAGAYLVSFDRPGMGRSDLVPAQDMTIDVEDAIRVADHLGIDRFSVIGVSAGGPPAYAISAVHPERLLRTVLGNGSGPYDDEAFMPEEDIKEHRRLRALGAEALVAEYEEDAQRIVADVGALVDRWFADFPDDERRWIMTPPARTVIVADFREALRQGGRGWLRETEVRAMPWSFDPADIVVPVRAFHGERDAWELLANTRRVIDRIPGATLTVYPGGDHLAALIRPGDLLAAAVA